MNHRQDQFLMTEVSIEKGKFLIYRVFDIGEEINLSEVEKILRSNTSSSRYKLSRDLKRKAIIINDAPLIFTLGEDIISINNQNFHFEVHGKVWTFGTLSLTYQFNIPTHTKFDELIELSALFENADTIDLSAKNKSREFTQQIAPAMKKTNEWDTYEDYVLYYFEKINGIQDGLDLTKKVNIPALILSESKEHLSDSMKKSILEKTYQYSQNDLSIIDWNSGLVLEPSGSMDIPDVIEFALNQLLEMRYYDDLLDDKLAALYNNIEGKKSSILSNQYSDLATEASQKYLELSEIIETIENSFKVVGDFYLAIIFRAASERFRFKDWLNNINSKLNNLAEVSKVLLGEVHAKRAQASEIIIILLIAFEFIPMFYELFTKSK